MLLYSGKCNIINNDINNVINNDINNVIIFGQVQYY
jgi:hypothetical protein